MPKRYELTITLKLHQLRDFVAVARTGGIRPASRELGLSQPSLTKSIQQLEASLDVPLFERSGKGLRLTAFGEAFYVRTQRVVNDLRFAEDEIRQMRSQKEGRIAFSMSGVSLLNLLPGALETFQRRYPEVTVRVLERPYDQAVFELRNGELDFAVLPEPAEQVGTEFTIEPLLRDRYAVIGRRGHPLSAARTMEELLDASWIVTRQGGVKGSEFEQHFIRRGLRVPRVEIHCESIIGVLSLVAQTDLLAILPSRWLHTEAVRHVTQEIAVEHHMEINATCVMRRAGLPLAPAADAFVAALVVEAGEVMRCETDDGIRMQRS